MLYTDSMKTKIGVHYHIRIGPEVVQLYNHPPLAGPYYDFTLDDMEVAHELFIRLVNEHLPEYLDEDDEYEMYEFIEYMSDEVQRGEMHEADMGVEELGFEFELTVCSHCVPKGMN